MLKSYLTLILLAVSFLASAQQYKLDSVVHTINGTRFIASQKYDSQNKKLEFFRYKRAENNRLIEIERTQVEYDNKGNELCYIFSIWNSVNDIWDEDEKTEKEYDTDNKLIHVNIYRKQNNSWIKVSENTRVYTQDSIIETDYETRENKFQPIHKNISVINVFNKIKTHETFLWSNEKQKWQELTRVINQYKNDTILIGSETSKWEENQWKKQEKVVYELDIKGLKANNYILYNARNNHWIPLSKFEEKEFSMENKKISSTYKWIDADNKWIVHSQTETFLNKEGRKQDVLFSELDTSNNQLKLKLELMHFYDKAGRLKLFQEFDHTKEKVTGKQNSIKFDKAGNVIQENLYELGIDNDTWNDIMTTEFEYYQQIGLDSIFETHKNLDLFDFREYNYATNKYATKQVKTYKYQAGKKVLYEEVEYFYSVVK